MTLKQLLIIFAVRLSREATGDAYDEGHTLAIAESIYEATDDYSELETLVRIARWEGGFRRDIANCSVRGDSGQALGPWQVHYRNDFEKVWLCNDYVFSAKIALERMNESYNWCRKFGLKGSDLLSGYTVGKCTKNSPSAKIRWGNGNVFSHIFEEYMQYNSNEFR